MQTTTTSRTSPDFTKSASNAVSPSAMTLRVSTGFHAETPEVEAMRPIDVTGIQKWSIRLNLKNATGLLRALDISHRGGFMIIKNPLQPRVLSLFATTSLVLTDGRSVVLLNEQGHAVATVELDGQGVPRAVEATSLHPPRQLERPLGPQASVRTG